MAASILHTVELHNILIETRHMTVSRPYLQPKYQHLLNIIISAGFIAFLLYHARPADAGETGAEFHSG